MTSTAQSYASIDGPIDRWTLRSPARLHFGLLEICRDQPLQYGGLGVAIDEPATELSCQAVAASADSGKISPDGPGWSFENAGPWQARLESVLERWLPKVIEKRSSTPGFMNMVEHRWIFRVDRPPEAHAGLGSGTQIACALATLIAGLGLPSPPGQLVPAEDIWRAFDLPNEQTLPGLLAQATGRGARSYVGLGCHLHGGLIVDHGIPARTGQERAITRLAVSEAWHVVLARPLSTTAIHGSREIDYFARCAVPNPNRNRMVRMIDEEIIPAIESVDLARFGDAVFRYGRYAGEVFQSAQGGFYRDAEVTDLIETVRSLGMLATGQSSWGPTVYTIVENQDDAAELGSSLRAKYGSRVSILNTRLTNQPATLHVTKVTTPDCL